MKLKEKIRKPEPLIVSDLKNITLPLSSETYEQLKQWNPSNQDELNYYLSLTELRAAYKQMNDQEMMDLHTRHTSRFD